jgi:pSer/pThr/pTyr-binding forkhead associated (FHA) protein
MTRPLKHRTSRLAPRLVIESGPSKGDEYIVRKPVTLIGRNESCDLVVSDPLVSRRHCQILWDGVYCTVEDLGSTNGTFVNNQQLTAAYSLRPGDRLQVADVVFHFADPQATLIGHNWPKLKIERSPAREVNENWSTLPSTRCSVSGRAFRGFAVRGAIKPSGRNTKATCLTIRWRSD